MKRQVMFGTFVITAAVSVVALAGIPIPDAIMYGQACINGSPASDQDDVTIIARANVDGEIKEVGRYKMGDHPPASDCDGDNDCYVLRIRMESVPTGTTPSGLAVIYIPNNTSSVQLFIKQGNQPEESGGELEITDTLTITGINLRNGIVSIDLNADQQKNLTDYQIFKASFLGPDVPVAVICNPADFNGDGHVDLRDAAFIQREIAP